MSWSLTMIGHPENVAKALEQHAETLTGQSLVEFNDAKPHLVALVTQNTSPASGQPPIVRLEASGSGYAPADPTLGYRNCRAKIEPLDGRLV